MFQFAKAFAASAGFLLALCQFLLRRSDIGGGRLQQLTIRVALSFQSGQPMLCLGQLRFGSGGTHQQFRAAFLVMPALGMGPFGFQLDLVKALAVFADLGLDGIAALGAVSMFGFELLNRSQSDGASPPRAG